MKIISTLLFFIFCTMSCIQAQLSDIELETESQFPLIFDTDRLYSPSFSADRATSHVLLEYPSLEPQAFFCRLEHQADKGRSLKLRFRLGSFAQAQYLEGKWDPTDIIR